MKKALALLLVLLLALGLVACGGGGETTEPEGDGGDAAGKPYKAALLLNGTLGDKSFYDSANEGLTRLRDELGADVFDFKVEQMGGTTADEPKWEPTLLDYCDSGEYDVIIMGTWQMAAPQSAGKMTAWASSRCEKTGWFNPPPFSKNLHLPAGRR